MCYWRLIKSLIVYAGLYSLAVLLLANCINLQDPNAGNSGIAVRTCQYTISRYILRSSRSQHIVIPRTKNSASEVFVLPLSLEATRLNIHSFIESSANKTQVAASMQIKKSSDDGTVIGTNEMLISYSPRYCTSEQQQRYGSELRHWVEY